ncbi:MAG: ATPase [Hyphomicrobiales bacterium]|nr:ATPase [Hyphomicrobiales bacterium]
MRDILSNIENGNGVDPQKDPQRAAQEAMRPKLPKRFYKQVSISDEVIDGDESQDGTVDFSIHLDGREVKTPARNPLRLPNEQSAKIVAAEWEAQEDSIDASTMPATRLVNTAIDGIATDPQAVLKDMLKFAGSDLICYRASTPPDLIELQNKEWNPILDWISEEFGARFESTQSLIQIEQPKEAITAISVALRKWQDPISIGSLHTFTTLTGSVFLALTIAHAQYTAEQAWKIAHVDEDWNICTWGEDYEAKKRRDNRWKELEAAYLVFQAINTPA